MDDCAQHGTRCADHEHYLFFFFLKELKATSSAAEKSSVVLVAVRVKMTNHL